MDSLRSAATNGRDFVSSRCEVNSMKSGKLFIRPLLGLSIMAAWGTLADDFQGATHMMPFDEGAIAYSHTPAGGPVVKLQERIDKGEATLKRDEQFGYLLSILDELKVRKSSQM